MRTNFTTYHNRPSLLTHYIHLTKTATQLKQTHTTFLKLLTEPQQHRIFPHFLTRLLLHLPGDNLGYAHRLFDQLPHWEKTQFLWTSFIKNHVKHSHFLQSIILFSQMLRNGVPPSGFTFSSVLNACARLLAFFEGKQIHKRVVQSGFLANKVVLTALLDMYAKCGFLTDARVIFDDMSSDHKDVIAYTAMICAYAKMSMMDEAGRLFDAIGSGNVVSWTAMVAGYANSGDMRMARELYDMMSERNSVTWVAMIAGYGKCGDVVEARRVFDGIIAEKDASCWAAMVACYSQNGCANEAIHMFKNMRILNIDVSEVAMVAAISACTQLGDWELAMSLAEDVKNGCCKRTSYVSNALIHMHAKHGCLDRAWEEFNMAEERDVVSYSSMITSLADHGKFQEALDLFDNMQKKGLKPNSVAFVGVLNACSNGGLIEEGCNHFELMTEKFNILPSAEHLTCMVDLLGKAGQLERAYNLIAEYGRSSLDPGTWGALLGACSIYGNATLSEMAARHLWDLKANDTGNYVSLANSYALNKKWDDAAKMWTLIRRRGLTKSPGCSWIAS